jgi:SNF family Na+-dependent transporter
MGSKIKFGRGWEIMSKYVYPVVLVVILLAAALLGIS